MKPKARDLIHKEHLQRAANALATLSEEERTSDMTVHVAKLKANALEFKGDGSDVEFLRGVNAKARELEEAWARENVLNRENHAEENS